jgi:hypothetical protein
MRTRRRPIQTPPPEFGFTPDTFRLAVQEAEDPERLQREADERRRASEIRRDFDAKHQTTLALP